MKVKSRWFILGLLMVSFALISSISLTVAWFIGASYLQIAQIDIKTKSPTLQLSTDNIEFKNSLAKSDLQRVDDFKPVSSIYYYNWTTTQAETPVFYGEYKTISKEFMTSPSDVDVADYGYFSQTLYLKSDQSVYVTLVQDDELEEGENPLFYPDEEANLAKAQRLYNTFGYEELTVEQITQGLNDVVKSLRVSLLLLNDDEENIDPETYDYHIIDPYYDKPTYYGGILDNDLSGTYDNYNGQEVIFGWVNDSDCVRFDEPLTQESSVVGYLTCFNSGHARGVKRYDAESSFENNFVIEKEPALKFNSSEFYDVETETGLLIPLKANVSRRIVLSIYLEGWDEDNNNLTMFGKFLVNLQFKILRSWVI